jgi:hypothetical protein
MPIKSCFVTLFALAAVVAGLVVTFQVGFKLGSLRAHLIEDVVLAHNLVVEGGQHENHRAITRLSESLKRDHQQLIKVVRAGSLDRFLLDDRQVRIGLNKFEELMNELDVLIENGQSK